MLSQVGPQRPVKKTATKTEGKKEKRGEMGEIFLVTLKTTLPRAIRPLLADVIPQRPVKKKTAKNN